MSSVKNSSSLNTICMLKKKFMEIDYNMLVQIMFITNMLFKTITLWGGGAMVKDLIFQCGGEEFKSSHL